MRNDIKIDLGSYYNIYRPLYIKIMNTLFHTKRFRDALLSSVSAFNENEVGIPLSVY